MTTDSTEARLFAELDRRVRRSPLGPGGFGYHRRARFLDVLADRIDDRWWLPHSVHETKRLGALGGDDDSSADESEPDEIAVLQELLGEAWQRARAGTDPSYGAIHALTLEHPLSALPLVGRFWTRGPWPMPGSATTLNAFAGGASVSHGPSMRWIADPATPDNSLICVPGGQSGHPFDPHYDDQLDDFLAGRYRRIAWSPAAIEQATVSTLELHP